jgi:diaphanous 1
MYCGMHVFLRILTSREANVISQTLRYIKPPDSLLTQLDVYTEEKFEDEEDSRERMQNFLARNTASAHLAQDGNQTHLNELVEALVHLAEHQPDLYPLAIEILQHINQIIERDIDT